MPIQIYRTPQRRDDTVEVAVEGHIVTINGIGYDLSEISEPSALENEFVVGPVFRLNGDVHVRIVQPYGANEDPPAADGMPDAPLPDVPMPPLTARQFRLGLVLNGFTPDQVTAAIQAMPDEQDKAVAKVEWEYASQFERDHHLIEQVGAVLGLDEDQIDTMWQQALTL